MPYIRKDRRFNFDEILDQLPIASCGGDLNYIFTKIAKRYLKERGRDYQNFSDVLMAFEGAKLEMYRRMTGPYEDEKISENGDVEP